MPLVPVLLGRRAVLGVEVEVEIDIEVEAGPPRRQTPSRSARVAGLAVEPAMPPAPRVARVLAGQPRWRFASGLARPRALSAGSVWPQARLLAGLDLPQRQSPAEPALHRARVPLALGLLRAPVTAALTRQ